MKDLSISILIIFVLESLFQSCANPGTVTGGPKDSIPPKLIISTPEDQTLNFKGQTLILIFDEFVNADKLSQSLIITPITENKFKHIVKKQTVILKFEEPFEDSTTYTFNFFDGITDITERNPAENLILAFSTENYIDSLEIFGHVKDLLTNKPMDKMIVGLYRITDSLNFFLHKPTYFITTKKSGAFKIQNIKQNKYKLLAFTDENKNLLFDPEETYAFLNDTLDLTKSIEDSIQLKALKVNPAQLILISARTAGKYFEIRYSKQITKYHIDSPDSTIKFATNFSGEDNETIRFYNSLSLTENDSLKVRITAFDSLGNNLKDTLFVKFRESTRKSSPYTITFFPEKNESIFSDATFSLNFNKPTYLLNSSFVSLRIDTLYNITLPTDHTRMNFNRTKLSFTLPKLTNTFIKDTLQTLKKELIGDSTNVDSLILATYNLLDKFPINKFQLKIEPGSFASVENDTSVSITNVYNFGQLENFGVIKLNINTSSQSYQVQIMKNTEVVQSQWNCKNCNFQRIPAGEYWVRIMVDKNKDGKWSIGNFQENIEPEPVIYFPEKTTLRVNWENELNLKF